MSPCSRTGLPGLGKGSMYSGTPSAPCPTDSSARASAVPRRPSNAALDRPTAARSEAMKCFGPASSHSPSAICSNLHIPWAGAVPPERQTHTKTRANIATYKKTILLSGFRISSSPKPSSQRLQKKTNSIFTMEKPLMTLIENARWYCCLKFDRRFVAFGAKRSPF